MNSYQLTIDHQGIAFWIADISSQSKLDLQAQEVECLFCMRRDGFSVLLENQRSGKRICLSPRTLERANLLQEIVTLMQQVSSAHESFYEALKAKNAVHWLHGISIRDYLLSNRDDRAFVHLISYLHATCVGGGK